MIQIVNVRAKALRPTPYTLHLDMTFIFRGAKARCGRRVGDGQPEGASSDPFKGIWDLDTC